MVTISVLKKISINDIDIKSFRVSRMSDVGNMGIIGILFLKCREGTMTNHNRSLLPGYIHMKSAKNLGEGKKHISSEVLGGRSLMVI
jgi:hypothetical protein